MRVRFALLLILMLLAAPSGAPTSGQTAPGDEAIDEELREFVPSEEVKIDTAIALPVDI